MPDLSVPFPTLIEEPIEPWQWPKLPFEWPHIPAPEIGIAQPCRIEMSSGETLEGMMLGFDPSAGHLELRQTSDSPVRTLAVAQIRQLTLTAPLRRAEHRTGVSLGRVPTAKHQREYRLQSTSGGALQSGQTVGYVETDHGLFLFTPVDGDQGVKRVFLPRSAYVNFEFGPSAKEAAATRWIATRRELLDALESQRRRPVLPIGQALLELGMVTQAHLDAALAQPVGTSRLGETLVANGVILPADLQTAIAHKMGYPMVDLARFPIDPQALAKIPLRKATEAKAVPLMVDGHRLIVAINEPSRTSELSSWQQLARLTVVAVIATEGQINLTLGKLSFQGAWSHVSDFGSL